MSDINIAGGVTLSDALTNPTAPAVGSYVLTWDGTQWLRSPAPRNLTLLASAARTTAQTTADQTNLGYRGLLLYINVTAASGTGGLTFFVQGKDGVSGNYYDLSASPAARTTVSQAFVSLYPGAATSSGVDNALAVQMALPAVWRLRVAVGDASSYTYSVGAALIP